MPTFSGINNNKSCFVVNTRRDFVYVDDLVEVVLKAIDGQGSGTYHVSSGKDISIKDLWDSTVKSLNIEYPVDELEKNPDDAGSILLDPSVTQETFNWSTKTNLEEGVKKTIEYYKNMVLMKLLLI